MTTLIYQLHVSVSTKKVQAETVAKYNLTSFFFQLIFLTVVVSRASFAQE